MRSAPQRGFLRLSIRIRSLTSCGCRADLACRGGFSTFRNKRKPLRCQATTVSALTIISEDFQSLHTRRNQTQKIRSAGVSFRRFGADRRKTASCCRKARFSSRDWAEVLSIEVKGAEQGEQVLLRRPTEQIIVHQLQ